MRRLAKNRKRSDEEGRHAHIEMSSINDIRVQQLAIVSDHWSDSPENRFLVPFHDEMLALRLRYPLQNR